MCPGPREPLYLEGATDGPVHPGVDDAPGMGLNITVHSYLDQLAFGLISCRELVPDLWDLVDLHIEEIDNLVRRPTGATRTAAGTAGPPRRGRPARRRRADRPRRRYREEPAASERLPSGRRYQDSRSHCQDAPFTQAGLPA